MAGDPLSIGEEEFKRLQNQLIELRTENYQLQEKHAKQNADLSRLQNVLSSQTHELEKANKAMQKSKKAKEYSALLEENGNLQEKIAAQEEDFKLQNRTMMEELSSICDQKDQLSAEVDHLKLQEGVGSKNTSSFGTGSDDENRQLLAENAALKKSLEMRNNLSSDNVSKSVDEMFDRLKRMSAGDEAAMSTNAVEEDSLKEIKKVFMTSIWKAKEEYPSDYSDGGQEVIQELQLKLTTTEEEKKIMQEQLKAAQEAALLENKHLKLEVEKWTEKAKKKQDSYVQLQEEKEHQYQQQWASFEETIKSRDAQIKSLREDVLKAQDSLTAATHDTSAAQELKDLKEGNEKLQRSMLLVSQEAKSTQEVLNKNIGELMLENSRLAADRAQSDKLAESRKNLLDEMSKKHQENLKLAEEKQKSGADELRQQLCHEQEKNKQLATKCSDLEQHLQRLQSLSDTVASCEQRLRLTQEELEQVTQQCSKRVALMEMEHQKIIKELTGQLSDCQEDIEQKRKTIAELEMVKQDKESEIKIVEKKTAGLIRDLRRQVQQMQRREEKLQQLNSARLRGVDDVVLSLKREASHDTSASSQHSRDSSDSSLRAFDPGSNLSSMSNNQEEPLSVEESRELMAKVTQLQLEKAMLEEKVSHLENTGSALAEDVMQKSAIIHQYFMETKADHEQMDKSPKLGGGVASMVSPLRLMQKLKPGGHENLQETNRKMQRALEEALMKNIHLQKNIDMLSGGELHKQSDGTSRDPGGTT